MGPHQDYVEVMQLIFAGKLRPVIGAIYPLREGIAALERMQTGDFIGKLVLEI
jgi:NADPH:quinone reductase-like Zn-dependent oxidoreductase